MLGLHDEQATINAVFMLYVPKKNNKKKLTLTLGLQCGSIPHHYTLCPMLSLHNKPTLTSKVFNAGFNVLLTKIRNHLLCYLFGNAYFQYVGELYTTNAKNIFYRLRKGFQKLKESTKEVSH